MGKSQCINATAIQWVAMFHLAESIENWKKQFYYRKGISPWDIYELSQHLEEEIALHQQKGLSDEQAFQLATEHLGTPETIEHEFNKLDRSKKNGISLAVVAKIYFSIFARQNYFDLIFFSILSGLFIIQWWIYYHFTITPAIEFLRIVLFFLMHGVIGLFSLLALSLVQFKKINSITVIQRRIVSILFFMVVDFFIILISLVLSIFLIIPGVWFYKRFFLVPWIMLNQSSNLVSAMKTSYWLTSMQTFLWFYSLLNLLMLAFWVVIMHYPYQIIYQSFYLVFKTIFSAIIYHYLTVVVPVEED